MTIDIQDVQLKSLANLPVVYNGVSLVPKTLRDIASQGYETFHESLAMIMLTKEKINSQNEIPEFLMKENLFTIALIQQDFDFITAYLNAFSYFCSTPIKWERDDKVGISFENELIKWEDFDTFAHIIKVQNCAIEIENEAEFNVASKSAQKIKDRILARRKKVAELKSQDQESTLNFSDLVSIVSANANGINIMNVWDLNYYQFNDQFNRMKMIEDYNVNIQAVIHGADSKELDLKHWMSKMK